MTENISGTGTGRVHKMAHDSIREMIEDRSYIAGDRIPSERDLAERLKIHRMTVRKAVDSLVLEGVLERRGTSGTYVPAPIIMRPVSGHLTSHSISETVRRCGGEPGSRLLFFEQRGANRRSAERLEIRPGDPVIVIKRLRTVDAQPFCMETTYLPSARVPGLAADDLFGDKSLYALMEDRYGIRTVTSSARIGAAPASPQDAEILGLKRGESALVLHSVVSDTEGKPVEYLTSLNHPRRVMLTIE